MFSAAEAVFLIEIAVQRGASAKGSVPNQACVISGTLGLVWNELWALCASCCRGVCASLSPCCDGGMGKW